MGRRLVLFLSLLGILASGVAVPAAADTRRTPAECVAALDCTAEDINLLTMAERLELVRGLQSGPGALLGVDDRWRNIEGVITFFRDKGLGTPGTWVSYVDAGIVEGIERGLAIALGRSTDDFGNPGSVLWADYITGVADGSFATRGAHDRAWSLAEQASTEHGVVLAERHGQYATPAEERFYQFSETYRWALRNRPFALDLLAMYGWLIHPDLARARVPFYDWFTDVRESAPSYKGCEMAYGFARLHPIAGVIGAAGLFLAYVTELFDEYRSR
ncbi:hypothetical protein [Actinophytocola gossypii]|uniref:Uncharacterized protein n=1 Tax=Actinophytocola gossypii TaxID=2812003 RepID=A0ABT2JEM9_9PSEU|nr:hypothetical protein [Actinophytocola gossypii]MCT2586334.1 hypothetical protein [Actinophytocola gossypii]